MAHAHAPSPPDAAPIPGGGATPRGVALQSTMLVKSSVGRWSGRVLFFLLGFVRSGWAVSWDRDRDRDVLGVVPGRSSSSGAFGEHLSK